VHLALRATGFPLPPEDGSPQPEALMVQVMRRNDAPDSGNPYLNARREWNERYGDYIARAHTWQLIAIASLCIAGLAVGGLVYTASQNRFVPYVVAVDRLGDALAVGRADVASVPDQRVIRAQLARWIVSIRSVFIDAAAERALLTEAYAMVNRRSAAYTHLNEYFRANDPFERARTETVSVEVQSVLPITGDTWRIEWREIRRARDGALAGTQDWQANVTITTAPPADESMILLNPMGIYLNGFSWSQRMG
jgi:type IV secretion system protein TrbF